MRSLLQNLKLTIITELLKLVHAFISKLEELSSAFFVLLFMLDLIHDSILTFTKFFLFCLLDSVSFFT